MIASRSLPAADHAGAARPIRLAGSGWDALRRVRNPVGSVGAADMTVPQLTLAAVGEDWVYARPALNNSLRIEALVIEPLLQDARDV